MLETAIKEELICEWCEKPLILDDEKSCLEELGVYHNNQLGITLEVFESPWDITGRIIYLHRFNDSYHPDDRLSSSDVWCHYHPSCKEQMTGYGYYDFAYHECQSCGRYIVERCPRNGWREYFVEITYGQICLKCYEDYYLFDRKYQQQQYEKGRLPGNFFDSGELEAKGFVEYGNYFIKSQHSIDEYCMEALNLIENGYSVVTEYNRIAIGGLEGYVTMWVKEVEKS